MKEEKDKYEKVIEMLRRSTPVLESGDEIEREVVRRIMKERINRPLFTGIWDFLFGWTYVGWVRRSLVFASALLVLLFVFQQGRILQEINDLRNQTVNMGMQTGYTRNDNLEKILLLYRRGSFGLKKGTILLPEKQFEELLDSIDRLNTMNRKLEELLEKDPELKQIIEEEINKASKSRLKL